MIFKNETQLKKVLMEKCVNAVTNVKKKVHDEFVGNLNQFYNEFEPQEYIRTNALFNSLEVTGVKRNGNYVEAEVYFNTPSYEHGWVPLQSGNHGYSSWSDEKILGVVMSGTFPHGGYEGGTAIWKSSLQSLGGKQGIKNLLKQELKKQGL